MQIFHLRKYCISNINTTSSHKIGFDEITHLHSKAAFSDCNYQRRTCTQGDRNTTHAAPEPHKPAHTGGDYTRPQSYGYS